MKNLYFCFNARSSTRGIVLEDDILNIKSSYKFECYTRIEVVDKSNRTSISIAEKSHHVIEISFLPYKNIFDNKGIFDVNSFLNYEAPVGLGLDIDFAQYLVPYYLELKHQHSFICYLDAFVVLFDNYSKKRILLILENNQFGVLVDEQLLLVGFVIWFTSSIQRNTFMNALSCSRVIPIVDKTFFKTNIVTMKNKHDIMKSSLFLKNISYFELFYYGLERKLIDNQFVIDWAMYALEHNITHDIIVELAGLLPKESERAGDLIQKQISSKDDVMLTKGQLYNKVWFYLTLAADMSELGVID